jgi:hypothetical protein
MSLTRTWRSTLSMCTMMERGPKIILSSPPIVGSSHTSSLILIMGLLLHLHERLIMIMLTMTHRPRAITSIGIDLHLGQKPKLGGRYTDNSLIYTSYLSGLCISMFHFLSCSLLFLFYFCFPKHKRPKIFLLFLFVCFFSFLVIGLLHLLVSVWYSKNPKIFCFVCCFLLFLS